MYKEQHYLHVWAESTTWMLRPLSVFAHSDDDDDDGKKDQCERRSEDEKEKGSLWGVGSCSS